VKPVPSQLGCPLFTLRSVVAHSVEWVALRRCSTTIVSVSARKAPCPRKSTRGVAMLPTDLYRLLLSFPTFPTGEPSSKPQLNIGRAPLGFGRRRPNPNMASMNNNNSKGAKSSTHRRNAATKRRHQRQHRLTGDSDTGGGGGAAELEPPRIGPVAGQVERDGTRDGPKNRQNQTNSLTYGTDPARLWVLTTKPIRNSHKNFCLGVESKWFGVVTSQTRAELVP
jgi:hypothetical protein